MSTRLTLALVIAFSLSTLQAQEAPATKPAAEKQAPLDARTKKKVKKAIDRGLGFLRAVWDEARTERSRPQDPTHWGHPGFTALAMTAFYRAPRHYTNDDGPFLREPFEYLLSIQREDGAINDQPGLDNYITSVAMMALMASGEHKLPGEQGQRVQQALDRAAAFLRKQQRDEEEGYKPDDKHYGGPGYGSSQRLAVSPGLEGEGYFHMPGGQSGHPLSRHFRDGHEAWIRGEATPFLPGEPVNVLVLRPQVPGSAAGGIP